MARSKDKMLKEAIAAGQSGDLAHARELLLDLMRTDNREPLYWLLMSTAVESREERIYCLQNVLFLDPQNSAAKHDLDLLGAEAPEAGAPALLPDEGDWQTTEIAAPKIRKKKKKTKQKEEPWSPQLILGSIGFGVIVILLGYYAAQQGLLPGLVDATEGTPTINSSGFIGTAVTTQRPTATRQFVVAPRDPQELLAATYTPTPRYIATPHPDNATFQNGLAAYDNEDWASAANFFQEFLSGNPSSADAAYYLGESHLQLADYPAAQAAFEQAISNDAQFAPAYLGRAKALIGQQAPVANILTDLNTAILLDQNLVEGYLERADFNLARGNNSSALEDVAAAEIRGPQNALVQYEKALVYLAMQQYDQALQASQRAYELDLTLLPNYLAKAKAQQGVGDFDGSIETLQSYLSFQGNDGKGWELLGLGYQLNDQEDLGLEAFERALSIDANLPTASYYRGLQELEAEQFQSALSDFRVAVMGEPNWFEARIYLAQAYLATGNPSSAFFEISAGSSFAKTDEQRAMLFYWRAKSLEALGQAANAMPDWQSLVNLPAEVVPAEWRAEALEHLNQ